MIGSFLVFLNFVLCQFQHAIEFKYTKAQNQKEQISAVHLPVTWPGKSYRATLCYRPERKASLTSGKAVLGFNFSIKRRVNWKMKNMLSLDF